MDGFTQDAAQTPDLLVLYYFLYSLVLVPFRDGEERQLPESSGDQTLSGEKYQGCGRDPAPPLVPGAAGTTL